MQQNMHKPQATAQEMQVVRLLQSKHIAAERASSTCSSRQDKLQHDATL